MEVTRQNFKETLPLIQASIERADFLVIDAEFTGLNKGRDVSLFDSPSEYYTTILNGCSEFLLTQYGLCAFFWDADKNEYKNEAYNFYLFPRGNYALEKIFLCQSSSLDFLAAQGFDFNKWIKDGISYATEPIEQHMRARILEKQSSDSERQHIPVPDENKQQIEDICKKVKDFIDNNDQEEMTIDRCNPFIRRLLFQELGSKFKDEVLVEAKVLDNKERVLIVTRIKSANDTNNKKMMRVKKEWDDFEEAIGFSKVARMISQSGKLVVGHNMLLDMLHTLSHFFQDLPSDYDTFKEFAHCMFPRILDTKYMSSMPPFKDKVNSNVLQHLYLSLSEEPFSLPKIGSEPGRGYAGADAKQHEAGYDAFVTGACLLAMRSHLSAGCGAVQADAHLKPFVNKLFLAKTARQDSPYMNLEGDDPTPSREHVFYMTFPKEWQRNEINQLFSPFGQIIVQFLDDTHAYVALANRKRCRDMMKALSGHDKVSLVPFAVHKGLQAKSDHQLTPKTILMRTSNTIARQDSREDHRRRNGSAQSSPAPVQRPVEKITIELDEPVDLPAPSPKKSRTRSTSTSKETEKHKITEAAQEVSSQPATKKSRLRTNSASFDKWKIEDITPENDKGDRAKRAKPQSEDVFAGAPRTVSVFKESDSWL
ncbi:poly(A)-specific ribonuclease PARN-like isoform X2 [Plodia interpunctella]|uniref:poly(A)-specific ribonuclease PARN-like isoform X2 n=1 Tax=Plodia interpunctella TaxID=58824 RepID=UPI002367F8EE|nr:poly(A)-specific ribonuclease PARN-like isoform X2 [Plodia interpunctella]